MPILAKTGVTPDGEGAQVDVYGDHFADGTFSSGEDVTVWTFSSQAALDADLARNAHPTDGARVAVGHLFAVSIVGVLPDGSPAGDIDMRPESDQAAARAAITYPVSPAVIAQRTGTTLRPAG